MNSQENCVNNFVSYYLLEWNARERSTYHSPHFIGNDLYHVANYTVLYIILLIKLLRLPPRRAPQHFFLFLRARARAITRRIYFVGRTYATLHLLLWQLTTRRKLHHCALHESFSRAHTAAGHICIANKQINYSLIDCYRASCEPQISSAMLAFIFD